MPRLTFPGGSLLAAMLGPQAPVDVRRAAQRLRAEGAPAVVVDDDIAGLAQGLALSEVSHSPAVLDVLPPLFWMETRRGAGTGGWVVEKKAGGLAARGFGVAAGREAVPMPEGGATVAFGAPARPEEDAGTRALRGLVAAIGLPGLLAQMGEGCPIVLMPAEASELEAGLLRGFRLSVAISPDSVPD